MSNASMRHKFTTSSQWVGNIKVVRLHRRKPLVPVADRHNLLAVPPGVFGLPHCPGDNSTLCEITRRLLDLGAYLPIVQNTSVQAQYWQVCHRSLGRLLMSLSLSLSLSSPPFPTEPNP
jgi:hypothetical protein